MNSTCLFTIHFNFGIGHRPFKNNKNTLAFPVRRNLKFGFIQSFFVGLILIVSIIVGAIAFGFPAGWNFYLIP